MLLVAEIEASYRILPDKQHLEDLPSARWPFAEDVCLFHENNMLSCSYQAVQSVHALCL